MQAPLGHALRWRCPRVLKRICAPPAQAIIVVIAATATTSSTAAPRERSHSDRAKLWRKGEKLPEGFEGVAEVDGYSGRRRSVRSDEALTLAFCWTHAKRGPREGFDSDALPVVKESPWRFGFGAGMVLPMECKVT